MVASREEVAHLEGAIEKVGYQGYRDSNYNRDGGFKRGGGPPRGGNRGGRLPRLEIVTIIEMMASREEVAHLEGAIEEVGYQGYRDS